MPAFRHAVKNSVTSLQHNTPACDRPTDEQKAIAALHLA